MSFLKCSAGWRPARQCRRWCGSTCRRAPARPDLPRHQDAGQAHARARGCSSRRSARLTASSRSPRWGQTWRACRRARWSCPRTCCSAPGPPCLAASAGSRGAASSPARRCSCWGRSGGRRLQTWRGCGAACGSWRWRTRRNTASRCTRSSASRHLQRRPLSPAALGALRPRSGRWAAACCVRARARADQRILPGRRDGWALPFPTRVQLARALLGALFAGALAEQGRAALALMLEKRLWPPLGISASAHECLLAWACFRQYMSRPGKPCLQPGHAPASRLAGSGAALRGCACCVSACVTLRASRAGDPGQLQACARLLAGVLKAARAAGPVPAEHSEEALPQSVAGALVRVLAEAAGACDDTPAGRERLRGIASLLATLRSSLPAGDADKARAGRPHTGATGHPIVALVDLQGLVDFDATVREPAHLVAPHPRVGIAPMTQHAFARPHGRPAGAGAVRPQRGGRELCAHGSLGCHCGRRPGRAHVQAGCRDVAHPQRRCRGLGQFQGDARRSTRVA